MRRTGYRLLTLCLFLAGFLVLMYPVIGNLWNQYRSGQMINTYEAAVEQADPEDFSWMLEDARAYNAGQVRNIIPDAFAVGELKTDELYESLLNLNGDGIMGYLEIPRIQVRLPIFHGTAEDTLKNGVGHLEGSALPVGGEGTHAVMAAHRGLPSAKLFTDLNLLEEGDRFYLYILDQVLAYEVDQIQVVEPSDTSSLIAMPSEDHVTLVTCTPYGVNTQRLLVRGTRTEYSPQRYAEEQKETKAYADISYLLVPCLGLLLTAAAAGLLYLRGRRKKKERQ